MSLMIIAAITCVLFQNVLMSSELIVKSELPFNKELCFSTAVKTLFDAKQSIVTLNIMESNPDSIAGANDVGEIYSGQHVLRKPSILNKKQILVFLDDINPESISNLSRICEQVKDAKLLIFAWKQQNTISDQELQNYFFNYWTNGRVLLTLAIVQSPSNLRVYTNFHLLQKELCLRTTFYRVYDDFCANNYQFQLKNMFSENHEQILCELKALWIPAETFAIHKNGDYSTGLVYTLVKCYTEQRNVKLVLETSSTFLDEYFNNGTLSIVRGHLENGSHDVAIGTLFINGNFDVEYGPVIFKDLLLIAFTKEKVIVTAKLLQVFSDELWMYCILAFGCMTILYYILYIILEDHHNITPGRAFMDLFRWSIGIGIGDLPKTNTLRLLVIFYIFFNIIIDTTYLGKLSSILTVEPFVEMNVPRLYHQIVTKHNTYSSYFGNIYQIRFAMTQRLNKDHFEKYFIQTNHTEWENLQGVLHSDNGTWTFGSLKIVHPSEVQIIDPFEPYLFMTWFMTFYISKHCPLKNSIQFWAAEIVEKGFTRKWLNDIIQGNRNESIVPCEDSGDKALVLDNFKEFFVIMGFGYLLALVLFVLEHVYNWVDKKYYISDKLIALVLLLKPPPVYEFLAHIALLNLGIMVLVFLNIRQKLQLLINFSHHYARHLQDETYEQSNVAVCQILKVLEAYDKFLATYRIRPDFFCRFKEKQILHENLNEFVNALRQNNFWLDKDASSSNEAVHLQQRLRSLSTELVTLRNRLHVQGPQPPPLKGGTTPSTGQSTKSVHGDHVRQPHVPPRGGPRGGAAVPPPVSGQKSTPPTIIKPPQNCARADIEDLIHLPGPLTEDAVMKCLQARFAANKFYTNVGPILLCVNPYRDVGNPLTLNSTRNLSLSSQLNKVVQEAVRQQSETGYPQAIILSGTSGSGKSHASMLLLRQLFAVAGGGPETDAFKHLAAAFTVLRSLGSAKTLTNSESSRIGQFIEVQVTDGALYRTKIHCYFLDQTRVIRPLPGEKNYHIFYQMLAGLSNEERSKLNLEGHKPSTLKYLQHGDVRQDVAEDASRFQAWKTCLGVLGIPFLDVVRVLAAVLLLGNVRFSDGKGLEVDVRGETELNAVAALLGVSGASLFRGLTSRTHNARGQLVKSVCDANMSNMTRDCLAKALYCRTVATIVRRANSLKRLGSTLGTLSSDSNESVHNQAEVTSQHASTVGNGSNSAGSKSMAALNNAVRHATTDGFIGILDMFGFEDPKPAQLEHLCINLCAETMQHFYNTHIFKSSIESCRDEGVNCEVEVDYVDNVPCIDLVSSLRTGLLSMLDVECSIRGTAESYISKIKVQHKNNKRLFDPKPLDPRLFGIQHFAGRVIYDATDFLDTNKDIVPDDLVAVFYKQSCNFGFATHLFGSELKALYSVETVPRGVSFRISPTSHTDLLNGDEPVSTLTQDFHTRLDNLLRTLVHARPHFVRCICSNNQEAPNRFDRGIVVRQIRSLQVLETVNLMAGGYPHRMRFKAFNSRYRLLAPFAELTRTEEKVNDDCRTILQYAVDRLAKREAGSPVSTSWALGKRHIFLSEGIRQQLEKLRNETRQKAATLIQSTWRGWRCRHRWSTLRREKADHMGSTGLLKSTLPRTGAATTTRPRPQPIAGTPPPDMTEKCDAKIIQQTCNLFGLDLERPPPVPPSRSYTVTGNTKLGYPQTRLMKMSYPEDASGDGPVLLKGEAVLVVGASQRRGHLIVEHKNSTLHVPFQFMELKQC